LKNKFRTGLGYDVHQFAEGRKLALGGVEIPGNKGLLGHSDADALIHSICDALLGALALGDIGTHFPDTDMEYKDADSKILLGKVYELVRSKGYSLGNLDCMLLLEKPKIAPYVSAMRKTIAGILNCDVDDVSIKATTNEKMGFIGRVEGAAAFTTVLLIKN
jgi:2-C-methyl-D-erythritol 2,4-cyclodiphosphate synthase